MKTIYLIRHGQAQAGTADYDRLSPLGEQQARILGRYLKSITPDIESVCSGTMKRQLQTCRLAHGFSNTSTPNNANAPLQNAALNEYDHRDIHQRYDTAASLPGTEDHDVSLDMTFERYTHIINAWVEDSSTEPNSQFERYEEFQKRAIDGVTDIANRIDANCIACYSSGGTISSIVAFLQNLGNNDLAKLIWELKNTSITTLKYDNSALSVHSVNKIDHLINESKSELITAI